MRECSKSTFIIPKSFTTAGGKEIKVCCIDKFDEYAKFGEFNMASNVITIADKVKTEDQLIEQTDEDKERTFYHELFHVFQFYSGAELDEMIAQTFSNFMYEYSKSRKSD